MVFRGVICHRSPHHPMNWVMRSRPGSSRLRRAAIAASAALGVIIFISCRQAAEQAAKVTETASHDLDVAGMDQSVKPGDDFFRYANGAWFDKTEIPPDRSSEGVFSALAEQARERTRGLLERAAANA